MPPGRMHADELSVDDVLVRRLLGAQFPEWSQLPLVRVPSDGTSNAIFRLGDDLALRLPRTPSAGLQAAKEHRWLPRVAPYLPLDVPVPVAAGVPDDGYPWPWTVYRWLPGSPATVERLGDPVLAATALGEFVAALRSVDATGGPPPGDHNFGRGRPLGDRDVWVRPALAELSGVVDTDAAARVWDAALRAPAYGGPPVWVHGDLQAGNLLAVDGRLTAVIDFGGLGVGDPACDVMAAWTVLPPGPARAAFRTALGADDAEWERGRGWALSVALIQLPYYLPTSPAIAENARRWVASVLADPGPGVAEP